MKEIIIRERKNKTSITFKIPNGSKLERSFDNVDDALSLVKHLIVEEKCLQ